MIFDKKIDKSIRKFYKLDSLSAIFFAVFNTLVLSFVLVIMRKEHISDIGIGILAAAPQGASLFIFFFLNLSFKTDKFVYISIMKSIGRGLLIIPILLHSKILFVITFFLFFIIEKGVTPTFTSIMKDIYPTKYRGTAMGLVKVEQTLITIILSVFAGKLFDIFNYQIIFFIGIMFGVFSQFFIYSMKKLPQHNQTSVKKYFHLKKLLNVLKKDKLMIKYFFIFMLLGISYLLGTALYPMYMVDVLHLSNFFVGISISLNSIAMIFGFYLWGRHIDKHNPLKTRVILIFILSCVPLLYGLLFFVKNYTTLALFFIFIASILQGFSSSGGELARINLFTRIIEDEYLEQYWAVDYFLLGIRGLIAPFIGIWLKNIFGFSVVFVISAFFVIISGVLMFKFYSINYNKLLERGLIG